ncbi:MAG: hypothetical protein QXO40_03935 [Candidatus Aenigmatarchaeota archaeon]
MIDETLIQDIIKSKQDPVYFIEKYCKILHPRYGIITPSLYDKQKELVQEILNYPFLIILKSRQIGVSTLYALVSVWMLIFFPKFRIGIISRDKNEAISFAERIERALLSVPEILYGGFLENNKFNKKLGNESEIIVSAPVKHALRGETLNYVILDEVVAMNFIEHIYQSVFYTIQHNFVNLENGELKPIKNIPSGISLISTGGIIDWKHPASCRGAIWFKQKWEEALSQSGDIKFKPIRIHWSETPFFNSEWYEKQKEILNYNEDMIKTELECEFVEKSLDEVAYAELHEVKQLKFPNVKFKEIPYDKFVQEK